MKMSKKLKKLIADLPEDKQKEVLKLYESNKVDDSSIEKLAEAIVNAGETKTVTQKDSNVKITDVLASFGEDFDADNIEKYVRQKAVDPQVRVAKYKEAKAKGNHEYVKDVNDRIVTYFKALMNDDKFIVKALTEGTDADGGYLVPEEFRAEVIMELHNQSVMRRIARTISMNTDTMDIPTETVRPVARWTNEDATIATSSAHVGEVTLTPHKLIGRIALTRELNNDSAIAVTSWLSQAFGQSIAEKEDAAFFTGNGTGKPKGVDAYTLATFAAPAIKADGLFNMFYGLKRAYRGRSAWVMNTSTLRNVRKLKDSDNQYLWQPGLQPGEPNILLGRPVYEQNDIASGKVFLGDFSYYLIGDRESISAETTTTGGTAWERDRIELKVRTRVDGKLALTNAIVEGSGF